METKSVGIVGAGLVGCIAGLALASRGYSVTIFDLRADPKHGSERNLKSINLAVSDRAFRALKAVDEVLAEKVFDSVIPMHGRMIHDITGTKQESQLYGLFGECTCSIDRALLNQLLLEELKVKDIKILFNHKLVEAKNIDSYPKLIFQNSESKHSSIFEFDFVIGADGAFSQYRYQMQRAMRMNFSQNYIDMQYMELYIPPGEGEGKDKFQIDPNHLHIWPRHNFMLIALPNNDGSFTSTFFSSWSLIESFKSSEEFYEFFTAQFPDAIDLLGKDHLTSVFDNNTRGSLIQINTYPYHNPSGTSLIMGDAAHLMVPFYGQGLNAGFEDVNVLLGLLETNNNDLRQAIIQYTEVRKTDVDTICKLAMDNYYEMASKVTKSSYLWRKKLDYYLGKYANGRLFQWIPMYTMISFRGDIPYSKAVQIEKRQERIISLIGLSTFTTVAIVGVAKGLHWWNSYKR